MSHYIDSEYRAIWKEFLNKQYSLKLTEIVDTYPDTRSLYVDFQEIVDFDPHFAEDLLKTPTQILKIGEEIIQELISRDAEIHLRISNPPKDAFKLINKLNSNDIDRLIALNGTVRKVTDPHPIVLIGAWKCSDCGGLTYTISEKGKLLPPKMCSACGKSAAKVKFELVLQKSKLIDSMLIELQDNPENIGGAQQPRRLEAYLYDDLVQEIRPGDRVIVFGVLRGAPINPKAKSADIKYYFEVSSIEKISKDWGNIEISAEDEERIIELSKRLDLVDLFKKSIAPSIYGYDIIKEALVLQMFGGVPKKVAGGIRKRGDIHILLVGDPGTAKSEMLMQVATIAPRAIYASGKGTSAAGLTAAAVRDKNNIWTLEAGALVIADGGMAVVDEIDKMNEEDRGAMYLAMEQQIVTIDKAGIHVTLPARCTILAAANPKYGRFDNTRYLSEQINLPPPLITRFDAIFKIIDIPNKERDNALAQHIIDIHTSDEEDIDRFEQPIDTELLRKYVVYAKQNIKPKMSDSAKKYLKDRYVEMRNSYKETNVIEVTPRQLEAMIRFAEASARLRLSDIVTIEDAKRAVEIVKYYLIDVTADATGGYIDIDTLYGMPHKDRELMSRVYEIIEDYEKIKLNELKALLEDIPLTKIEQILDILTKDKKIGRKDDTLFLRKH